MYQPRHRLVGRNDPRYLSRDGHWAVYNYFEDLSLRALARFEENWDKVAKFDPKESIKLSAILNFIAKQLPDHNVGSKQQREVGKYVKENFSIWQNKALASLKHFNRQSISVTAWSIATLGVKPSQKFMNEWYRRAKKLASTSNANLKLEARHSAVILRALAIIQSQNPELKLSHMYEGIREHLDEDDLEPLTQDQQVYEADLYFTGSSTIEEPDQSMAIDYIPRPPLNEVKLADVFRAAGYKVYRSEPGPIPDMKDAIDFTVEHKKTGQKVHIECDGPSHYLNPNAKLIKNLKYNMATRFLSALRTRQAPDAHIVRVNFRLQEIIESATSKNQKAFCNAVFNGALKKGPGCYYVGLEKGKLLVDMVPKAASEEEDSKPCASGQSVHRPECAHDSAAPPVPHGHPRSQSPGNRAAPAPVGQ